MENEMKYQLVLQFPGRSMKDFDGLVALESEVANMLPDSAEVDGHDFGSGEMNIFILTDDPEGAFESVGPLMARQGLLSSMKAAYRDIESEEFKTLWPKNLVGFRVL
jgi:hypothetical protein